MPLNLANFDLLTCLFVTLCLRYIVNNIVTEFALAKLSMAVFWKLVPSLCLRGWAYDLTVKYIACMQIEYLDFQCLVIGFS